MLLWGFGACLVLEAVLNLLLATGLLGRLLNTLFDDMEVGWSQGWSVVPGTVHVRHLTLRRQEPGDAHWGLDIDRADIHLSLGGLLRQRFETESLDVQGLRVHVHPGQPGSGAQATRGPPPGKPWKVYLHRVTVHDVHAFELDDLRLTGLTEVTGELALEPGQRIAIQDARVSFGPGELTLQDALVARVERGSGECGIDARRQDSSGELDLLAGLTDGRLQLTATLPSLKGLRRFVPALAGVSLEGGAGRLETDVRLKDGRGSAHVELNTEDFRARWGSTLVRGRLTMNVDARKPSMNHGTLKLDGTKLLLRDVAVRTEKDHELAWNGTLAIPEATLTLDSPGISGRFAGDFSNAAPFIALLTDQGTLPHWLSPLLTAKDLKVSGDVALGDKVVKLTKLRARGEGLELRAQAESANASTRAVVLVKVGPVPMGVEVTPEGAHVQVLEPTRWYTQRTGEPEE